MCRLADIEIDILVRKNEALKDEVCKLRTENDDLVYKLQGVMWSVDKWLDGKEFEQDEVNRAATMREKTLQITEQQQAEIERLEEEIQLSNDLISCQIAEIEKLQHEILSCDTKIKVLQEAKEQLEKDVFNAEMNCDSIAYEYELLKQEKMVVQAEAIKDFAKFLIDKIDGGLVTHAIDIHDCVVDFLEMTEKES